MSVADLIMSRAAADTLREVFGQSLPRVIVTDQPPGRWPLDQPWPPQVTLPAPPCWRCVTGPALPAPLDHLRLLAR